MRILFCGTYDPSTPRARQFRRLAEVSGHRCEVLNFPVWGAQRDSSFGPAWLAKFPALMVAYVRMLTRLLRGPKVDAVVFLYPGYVDAVILGWAARRCASVTVLDQFISIYDTVTLDRKLLSPGHPLSHLLKWLDTAAIRAVDRVVFDTPQHQAFAESHLGLESGKGRILWVGADTSVFHALEGVEVSNHVLFYGTFIPLHGTATIVRAAAVIPDVEFRVIGKGQQSDEIAELITELGLGNLTMIDPMPEAGLVAEICSARVTLGIFGTTAKAQRVVPNKVFQGAAMGKAVITEFSPAIDASFGDAVTTVPAGDPAALAAAIRDVMAPDVAELRGARAVEVFDSRFSDTALLEAFESIIG